MTAHGGMLRLRTAGDGEVVDLTDGVRRIVRTAGVQRGVVVVFVPGSTVAVTTMEFEPGGIQDVREAFERLIPAGRDYAHNRLNHDSNAHAHIRAAIVGPSESVPILDGELALGTWQQIVLLDFDDRPRERRVTVSVLS